MTRKFVTGASGTLGSKFKQLGFQPLDFRDLKAIAGRVEESEEDFVVVHCAGVVGAALVEQNPEFAKEVNVHRTEALASYLARQPHLKTFVNVSSSHVYGFDLKPFDESSPVNPLTLYAEQKLGGEYVCRQAFRGAKERLLNPRVFSVLDPSNGSPMSLGRAIAELAHGKRESPIRFADDIRDFLTPEQVARQITRLIGETSYSGVVNVASGVGLTVKEASSRAMQSMGIEPLVGMFELGKSEQSKQVANVDLLRNLLGETECLDFTEFGP